MKSNTEKTLQNAEKLMLKGDIAQAINIVAPLFESEPKNIQVIFLYGLLALHAKDYSSAIQILSHATKITTRDFKVNYHLALAYQLSSDYESAILWYENAISVDANSVEAKVNLAANWIELRDLKRAIEIYLDILIKQPSNEKIINLLSTCYYKKKDYFRAMKSYEKIDVITSSKIPNINIGHCFFYLSNDVAALEIYEKYTSKDIGYESACRGIINVYIKRRELKIAEKLAKKLIAFSPSARNKYNFALVLSHQTDIDKLKHSNHILTEVLQSTHLDGSVYDCLALVNMKLGYLNEALDSSKNSVEINSLSIEFKYTLQSIYTAIGELEKARRVLIDILTISPEHKDGLRQLGIVELRKKNPSDALAHLLKASELNSFDQRTISHQIIALQALGDFNQARWLQSFDKLTKTIDLKPVEYKTLKEFNRALEVELKNHESLAWEPKGLATKGGYMTTALENENSAALKGLIGLIIDSIEQYRLSLTVNNNHPFLIKIPKKFKLHLWGVILNQNGQVGPHIHEESWLSGAYYVKLPNLGAGKKDFSGFLEFGTPHNEIPYRFPEENKLIEPKEGKLILFPSYYFHQTIPYEDNNERISIAFDVEAIW
ncbi:MAG: tetratricopeptide (TPR) repeat protein [Polaribacter sp.]|jgi:tetratricopeptide (TPR) repeat protein